MNKSLSVNVEVRFADGLISHELTYESESISLNKVLFSLSEIESTMKMFENKDGSVVLLPGFLMVLNKRMIQPWEAENTVVRDGQSLRFVQVVAGG